MAKTRAPSGLFGGPTQGDVIDLMGREKQARIQQAMQAHAGGGYLPSLAAKARQEGIEALKQGFGGIAGSMGMPVREDPRLGKARKRETDRREITALLSGFSGAESEGGEQITEQEMRRGFSELMSRGYTQEAQQFLSMAQSFGVERRAEIKIGMDKEKFTWSKVVASKQMSQKDKSLWLQGKLQKHNATIDWKKIGISEDDLEQRGEIAFAKLEHQKFKDGKTIAETERANKAQETLRSRGYDITEDGNVIRREELDQKDLIDNAKLIDADKDFELRSDVHEFNKDYKFKVFGWQKKMDKIKEKLEKRGLTIREENSRISLVRIETTAATAKRSQDITAAVTREGHGVKKRGQDISAEVTREGHDVKEAIAAKKATALIEKAKVAASSNLGEAKFEGPIMKDKSGNLWQNVTTKDNKQVWHQLSGAANVGAYDPDGATIVNPSEMGKIQVQDSNSYVKSGLLAHGQISKVKGLLQLARKLKATTGTGGLRASLNEAKKYFGVEPKDEADFRTKTQLMLVKNLKRIMGARPTDKDLIELKDAMANLEQSPEANIQILTDFVLQLEKEIEGGNYFADNPGGTVATYNNFLRTKKEKAKDSTDPLGMRD